MNMTELTIEAHYRYTAGIVDASKDALVLAKDQGSIADYLKAIEVATKVQEFAGKELIRYRLRKTLSEAAGVLCGEFDGQDGVSLGAWSDGCSEDDIPKRAQDVLDNHVGLY
ncbi:hypothetical protein OAA10_00300 [bacterium]|nr:hypothetical protein [bacterium]